MNAFEIILASASPRRYELLRQIGIDPSVLPAHIDETPLPGESPEQYVIRMARGKASAITERVPPDAVIIGADTSVVLDRRILGKPANRPETVDMLTRLSGKTHQVLSAVSVTRAGSSASLLSSTRVRFRELTAREIADYHDTGEPADKAGAYGIQGKAAIFIEEIHGSYSGVMGLPLYETARLLADRGIDCLQGADS